MKPADINRFLVVCALISDLYCTGYDPKQCLAKHSNLARTAARFKVNASQIVRTVRMELSKPKDKTTGGTQPTKKPAATSARQPKSSRRTLD